MDEVVTLLEHFLHDGYVPFTRALRPLTCTFTQSVCSRGEFVGGSGGAMGKEGAGRGKAERGERGGGEGRVRGGERGE